MFLFCDIDFSQYSSAMEDCFSAVAFDVLENAANVCGFVFHDEDVLVRFLHKLKKIRKCLFL